MAPAVLVTGSSSGFGHGAVAKFLAEGWNVVAALRDPARWTGEISEQLLVHPLDVRDKDAAQASVAVAVDHFGGLDVVVNNAGIGLFPVFEATSETVMQEVFETNVFATIRLIRGRCRRSALRAPVFGVAVKAGRRWAVNRADRAPRTTSPSDREWLPVTHGSGNAWTCRHPHLRV